MDLIEPRPEPAEWTLAYRKPRGNRFRRVDALALTWSQTSDLARVALAAHPELEVWTVTTRAAELAGRVHPDDIGNVLSHTDRRVRIVEGGTLAALGIPTRTHVDPFDERWDQELTARADAIGRDDD